MVETKFSLIVLLTMAFQSISLLGGMSDEKVIVICAVMGTLSSIVFNIEFLKESKFQGIVVTLLGFVVPLLALQTLLNYYPSAVKIASIPAVILGLLSFEFIKYYQVEKNRGGIAKRLMDAFVSRAEKKIAGGKGK